MSLYNQIFGVNGLTAEYLLALNLHPQQVPRLRDSYLFKDQDGVKIALFTRLGGGNRESYEDSIVQLQAHPLYDRDFDDDFDSTYATFVFKIPEKFVYVSEEVIKDPSQAPMARFRQMLEDMQANRTTPDTEKAMEAGKRIVGQIEKGIGSGGIIAV